MKPIVILDSNSLYGRKPLRNANSRLLQALSKSGQIRLVVPDVVLQELARHWAEEADEHLSRLNGATKALNETLDELEGEHIDVPMPSLDRVRLYDHAKHWFEEKLVEIPDVPSIAVERLLASDLSVKKPFDRQGRGFRDALIWETIRLLCEDLKGGPSPVIFVTNNHSDFCDKDKRLHPDLREDLASGQDIEVISSIHKLLDHKSIKTLADSHREIEKQLNEDRLGELIDRALGELHGRGVEEVVGVYVGSGMYELPVHTGLEDSSFDEILPDLDTVEYDIFRDGDESTISVRFEADCSYDGLLDKGDYFANDGAGFGFLQDWNDHMFRVGTAGRVRFTLSGTVTGTDLGDLILTLDEVEDVEDVMQQLV